MASPLQNFNTQNKERWTVLRDMPEWILDPVINWIVHIYFDNYGDLRDQVINSIQVKMRIVLNDVCPLGISSGRSNFARNLRKSFKDGDGIALLLLDITAKYVRDYAPTRVPYRETEILDTEVLSYLEEQLSNGSLWSVVTVLNADAGIIERIDSQLVSVAEEIAENHLTKAWNYAFKLQPEPEKAVEEAQKAIESVATENGLTKLTTSVYGGLMGDIRANPGNYKNVSEEAFKLHDKLTKSENNINIEYSKWFATSLDLIQKTHPARHKSQAVKDFELSDAAAQQAVMIATMICWIISKKYLTKK